MKLFLLITGLALVSARAPYVPILVDYHEKVGIPEATRILKSESAVDFDGSRIAGGSAAGLGAHPYTAGLLVDLVDGRQAMCGGSLVSPTRLVTAAHCWRSNSGQGQQMTVVLGSNRLFTGGTRLNTTDIELHASYNQSTLSNDVAIIKIPPVTYNNNIRNIELPSGPLLTLTYAGERAVAVGFGGTSDTTAPSSDPELHQVALEIIQNSECANIYGPSVVISSTLCTDGTFRVGPCSGDTGGPLVYTFQSTRYLIGVISFVSGIGCQAGHPVGYARVTSFDNWIRARL